VTPVALPPGVTLAPPATPGVAPAHDGAGSGTAKLDPKLAKIAQEFESIFLRNLLKPLEKSGQMGKEGSTVTSGSSVYGSMMVGALADSASSGGGIGLAHLVLEALTRGAAHTPGQKPSK
jgi:Rod binding domain-containing protein